MSEEVSPEQLTKWLEERHKKTKMGMVGKTRRQKMVVLNQQVKELVSIRSQLEKQVQTFIKGRAELQYEIARIQQDATLFRDFFKWVNNFYGKLFKAKQKDGKCMCMCHFFHYGTQDGLPAGAPKEKERKECNL